MDNYLIWGLARVGDVYRSVRFYISEKWGFMGLMMFCISEKCRFHTVDEVFRLFNDVLWRLKPHFSLIFS